MTDAFLKREPLETIKVRPSGLVRAPSVCPVPLKSVRTACVYVSQLYARDNPHMVIYQRSALHTKHGFCEAVRPVIAL